MKHASTITFPGERVTLPALTPKAVACNIAAILCGSVFVIPLLWLALASVDSSATRRLKIPDFTLDNFANALQPDMLHALQNSIVISAIATLVATVPAVLAAYAFARYNFAYKSTIMLFIVFFAGVPINILILPVYEILGRLDMLSLLPTAIFLGVVALPFELFIIRNAIEAIPMDLEEAARLEGASTVRILRRVIVPLALPGICAAGIFGFVNTWGNFIAPLVFIADDSQQPSPIRLFGFMSSNVVRYGDVAAYSLIYSLPVVVLYLLSGRVFASGFVLGGATK